MRRLIMSLVFLAGGVTAVLADSESDGAAAEKAGKYREALSHYTAALQAAAGGGEKDQQLRERILLIARKIKPPMTIPDEALRFEGRAEAAIQEAKNAQDYLNGAKEYEAALKIAPWSANYYFNLGIVLDKAGKYPEAIQSFKLYLIGAPDSPDSKDVAKRIAGLEYKIEQQTSPQAQAAREQSTFEKFARSLEGAMFTSGGDPNNQWRIHVQNGQVVFGFFDLEILNFRNNRESFANDFGLMGAQRFVLTGYRISPFHALDCTSPGSLEISADGQSMTVRRTCPDSRGLMQYELRRHR